jgi:type IV secretory pathway VirB4 component
MSLLIAHTATHRASGWTGQTSIVLLDECWALLESPILASVVVQLFRTARKRNASVWGISQTHEDFVGTPDKPNEHGAGIVKNATTKIIGKQPGDMRALREHVHLNETALNQIKTFAHPKKGQCGVPDCHRREGRVHARDPGCAKSGRLLDHHNLCP